MGAVISLLGYMKLKRAKNVNGSQDEKEKTESLKLESNIITILVYASSFRICETKI
jgi:hypothetical protein